MMPTKHSWDDDEETIVNFTPKPRSPQVGPETSSSAYPPDALETGADYDASAGIEGATLISGPAAPVLTGVETPPGSDMYWQDPPPSRPPSPFAGQSAMASQGGQDPYLAASGLHDGPAPAVHNDDVPFVGHQDGFSDRPAYDPFPITGLHDPRSPGGQIETIPPAVEKRTVPVLPPPIPPLPDLPLVQGAAVLEAPSAPAAPQPPAAPEPSLPGFGPQLPIAEARPASFDSNLPAPDFPSAEPKQAVPLPLPEPIPPPSSLWGAPLPAAETAPAADFNAPSGDVAPPIPIDDLRAQAGDEAALTSHPHDMIVPADELAPPVADLHSPTNEIAPLPAADLHTQFDSIEPATVTDLHAAINDMAPSSVAELHAPMDEMAPRPVADLHVPLDDEMAPPPVAELHVPLDEIAPPSVPDLHAPSDEIAPPAHAELPAPERESAPFLPLAEPAALVGEWAPQPAFEPQPPSPPVQSDPVDSDSDTHSASSNEPRAGWGLPELPTDAGSTDSSTIKDVATALPTNIDPPTVMDVPIVARRLADQGKIKDLDTDQQQPEPNPVAKQVSVDREPLAAPEPAMAAASEPDEEAGIDGRPQDAAPDAREPIQDDDWNALCEAAVAGGAPAMSPPSMPPLPEESRSSPAELVAPQLAPMPAAVEASPPAAESDRFSVLSAPLEENVREPRVESEMERTNVRMALRPTDTITDLAWVAILKSSTGQAHQVYRLDASRMELGRAYDAPIFVDDRTVSTRHAAIRYERVEDRFEFVLYDLASTNGSFVNGVRTNWVILKDDDRIRVGETELVFKKVGDPPAAPQ